MTCKVYDEKVVFSYTLGELNEEEVNRLKKHLEYCSSCQSEVEEYFSLQEAWDRPNSYMVSNSFVDSVMKEISIRDKRTGGKNAFLHFALATAATFVLLYSGIFDQMYQSVGHFTTTFSETTNHVQQASVQGVNWLNVNFNFSQILNEIKLK